MSDNKYMCILRSESGGCEKPSPADMEKMYATYQAWQQKFAKNILDMGIEWKAADDSQELFEGRDRASGKMKWSGTRADLVFGSNSILRSLSEVYASADAGKKFTNDFVAAWTKVMNLDRFDLAE